MLAPVSTTCPRTTRRPRSSLSPCITKCQMTAPSPKNCMLTWNSSSRTDSSRSTTTRTKTKPASHWPTLSGPRRHWRNFPTTCARMSARCWTSTASSITTACCGPCTTNTRPTRQRAEYAKRRDENKPAKTTAPCKDDGDRFVGGYAVADASFSSNREIAIVGCTLHHAANLPRGVVIEGGTNRDKIGGGTKLSRILSPPFFRGFLQIWGRKRGHATNCLVSPRKFAQNVRLLRRAAWRSLEAHNWTRRELNPVVQLIRPHYHLAGPRVKAKSPVGFEPTIPSVPGRWLRPLAYGLICDSLNCAFAAARSGANVSGLLPLSSQYRIARKKKPVEILSPPGFWS